MVNDSKLTEIREAAEKAEPGLLRCEIPNYYRAAVELGHSHAAAEGADDVLVERFMRSAGVLL